MFDTDVTAGVLQVTHSDTHWLATGPDGGYCTADAAYNISVPDDFDRTDLDTYVSDRRLRAGFSAAGPVLLTGVALDHARGARSGPVEVIATAGLSNPATLPMDPAGEPTAADEPPPAPDPGDQPTGTVNLIVGTTCRLDDGTLASLLGTAVEAKTATLLATTGFSGTTTDAVIVGSDPTGESASFVGSTTAIGAATRACVREAIRASLEARYTDRPLPESVDDAEYGTRTDRSASVFTI